MSASNFVLKQKESFNSLSDSLFAQVANDESASLRLAAEDSLFVRFNAGLVRQNTSVEQSHVTMEFQSAGRTISRKWTLSGNAADEKKRASVELEAARVTASELPVDPFQVPMMNHGQSDVDHSGSWPSISELINEIASSARAGLDLAGLLCAGDLIAATRNSKGQSHWFSTRSFFLDYSLFNVEKAAKGNFAGSKWKTEDWRANLEWTRAQLEILQRPLELVKPGRYRTYLAPSATSDLFDLTGWGGLSCAAWKQGASPLKKFIEGERQLSPLLTVRENFDLGLSPTFNDRGEISEKHVPLIENGKYRSLLTSSRTAKEYGVASNAASDWESPRSLEVAPGSLKREDILREIGRGLYLSNLHYLNWSDRMSARVTGMTRYACFWVENGEMKGPIKDLRFDESFFDALGTNLLAVTEFQEVNPQISTYEARALGGSKTPGVLIDDFSFTL